ncbi:MafI family immunity protein [Nakamurella flava]|uniref:MafI family immunity protein n=1 Tax=Nakamurella flava TaxID=2576308 RepID=A0A4U6QAR2_9ACTN|nr:MafI family immunity protein [Nakamurella flava]TKV57074.1 MafI family immunity protein [Nakamurella flava]
MDFDEITGRLMACLTEAEVLGLPQFDVDNVRDLISHGEPGVALENLCTQLYELSIPVTAGVRENVAAVGAAMNVDQHYWTILEELDPARPRADGARTVDDTPLR